MGVEVSICDSSESMPVVLGDMERDVCKAFVGEVGIGLEFVAECIIVKADTDSENSSVAMTKSRRSIGDEEENVDIVQSFVFETSLSNVRICVTDVSAMVFYGNMNPQGRLCSGGIIAYSTGACVPCPR